MLIEISLPEATFLYACLRIVFQDTTQEFKEQHKDTFISIVNKLLVIREEAIRMKEEEGTKI